MRPNDYLEHLLTYGDSEHLGTCDLRPCSEVEIESTERETKLALPDEYVNFLCTVGAGDVYGGLGNWLHLDITRPGNVIGRSQAVMDEQIQEMKKKGIPQKTYPKGLLVIYDSHDGALYGLTPNSGPNYKPGIFCWDTEEHSLAKIADTFSEFLSYLIAEDENGEGSQD